MKILERRLSSLEARSAATTGRWHQLLWHDGCSWADVLAANDNGDHIGPGDNVILVHFVGAGPDGPVCCPVVERDRPIADAWLSERRAG